MSMMEQNNWDPEEGQGGPGDTQKVISKKYS